MSIHKLKVRQLGDKIKRLNSLNQVVVPPTGWIKSIRTGLGMTLSQLGNKLGMTKQAVLDLEKREVDGAITIKTLRDVAIALDMKLVYGLVPNDGSIEALIEKRAQKLATEIVLRTANTMELENQGNSQKRIAQAIKERTQQLIVEMPKSLWD